MWRLYFRLALGSKLHILNCHQYTETSDFLGEILSCSRKIRISFGLPRLCENNCCSQKLSNTSLMILDGQVVHHDVTTNEVDSAEEIIKGLSVLHQKWCTIFNWQDGPLVQAMKNGDLFLVDEISLADDSVLER
ncbi:AAA+ ATPase domain-containing protein [Artemisia annua]|uniref:AAA+ ATPase domain-containing protein n=1 Tax=Artemisia annua TaxID=35608 RepID=A0A2U1LP97_ARTAN|nr:AAA+ ATPase domain-containing protein [Artemisia annua]